jgi:hypothetical protein
MRRFALSLFLVACGTLPTTGDDAGNDASSDTSVAPDVQPDSSSKDGGPADVTSVDASDATNDVADASIDVWDGGPIALAINQGPYAIAIDANNVYWTNNNGANAVMKCAISGCTTPTPLRNNTTGLGALATDGVNVYFQEQFSLEKCAVGGCGNSPTTLASIGNFTGSIVSDGTTVYFTDGTPAIQSCAVGGCNQTPTPVVSAQGYAGGIALNSGVLYWHVPITQRFYSCPTTGCSGSPTQLLSSVYDQGPDGIVTDGVNVYFTESSAGSVAKCAVGGCNNTPTTLATTSNINGVATDGVNVYWSDSPAGTVNRCTISGTNPTTIATGQTSPTQLAVDGTWVYWVTSTTVMKAPK